MAPALRLIGLALLFGATSKADPIDDWVTRLSADPMWLNGTYPALDLPENATTREVVTKVLQMTHVEGTIVGYKILKIKKVRIKGGPILDTYTAVLIKPGEHEDVVLLQYSAGSWWSRVLSVP